MNSSYIVCVPASTVFFLVQLNEMFSFLCFFLNKKKISFVLI